MSIATPEGVDIDLTLAGVGSRFVATVIDQLIQWSILLGLAFLITLVGDGGGGGGGGGSATEGSLDEGSDVALVAVAVAFIFIFAVQAGYHILFETFASGRTPGKRWTGLRVVTTGGGPVNFMTSFVRNLLRVIDFLPGFYAVAIVAVLASSRNQRLGDMAAGTLVVRERTGGREGWRARRRRTRDKKRVPVQLVPRGVSSEEVATWDVSAVTTDELATVRRFLDRRATLVPEARARLARDLAGRLRPKVVGPPEDLHPEMFLEELAAAKAARL